MNTDLVTRDWAAPRAARVRCGVARARKRGRKRERVSGREMERNERGKEKEEGGREGATVGERVLL